MPAKDWQVAKLLGYNIYYAVMNHNNQDFQWRNRPDPECLTYQKAHEIMADNKRSLAHKRFQFDNEFNLYEALKDRTTSDWETDVLLYWEHMERYGTIHIF